MKKKKLNKLLVVGVGSIGKRHIDNNKNFFKSIDIADLREDRLQEANSKFKIHSMFKNYKIALNQNSYDAVLITTPPHLHLEIAKLAVKKKTHILIEKPLGMTIKGWKEISAKCKKLKLVNYVAYCHRHVNYSKILKKFLTKKKIGHLINANLIWGSFFPDWHPWEKYWSYYMAKKEQGGGALMDESHGIDLVRYFFGEPKEIFALVDKISNLKMTADDNAFLLFKMKNKMLINLSFDLVSKPNNCKIEIKGSKGTLIWNRDEHNLKFYSYKNKKWKIYKFSKKNFLDMYKKQAQHFVDSIYKKTKPIIDIEDAIKTQNIIDKCFLSQKTGKKIRV